MLIEKQGFIYTHYLPLYNHELISEVFLMSDKGFTPGGEDWENQILDQLVQMFKNMGMPIDSNTLKSMMEQIQSQFEEMGIDPEKVAEGKVELNLEATMNDLAKMMGKTFPEKEVLEVEVEATVESDDTLNIDENDIFIDGENMILTIDCSRVSDIDDNGVGVEIILTNDKTVLSVMVDGRPHPVSKYSIGKTVTCIEEWSINNGILDMTLKL